MNATEPFVYSGQENLLVMRHAKNYTRHLNALVRRYSESGGPVVDFGAGLGAFAGPALEWSDNVLCVEPDAHQMEFLRLQGFQVIPNLEAVADDSIGYVYTLNVLEHIEHDTDTLAEIFQKLRPGGRLLVYVPALAWLYTSMDERVGHFRRYRMKDLVDKIERVGYRIEHSSYVDSLGVLATLAFKLFGSADGQISTESVKFYDRFVFPLSRVLDGACGQLLGKNLVVVSRKV